MQYVYVIRSTTRQYIYVGISNNIDRRLNEHNKGKEKTTKPYRPFELIMTEVFENRIDARQREKYLKSGSGKEYIKSLIKKLY